MRRFWLTGLILSLGACQAPLPSTSEAPKNPVSRTSRAAATPTPEPRASATPTPTPAPTATPAATPTPTVPTTLLSGLVKVDASYIISTGGGNIIATGGGNIIAAGGGNIISTGGGNIIAAGGGNIIAAGGGNIIAAGGGNVIATGGGNFRTLLSEPTVAPGTMLPVQGMVVVPYSLLTRRQIAPAVKTDEQGRYTLAIPDSAWKDPANKQNIGVYAALPVESEQDPLLNDPRLSYEQIQKPEPTATAAVDEDSNQTTRYIFLAYESQIAAVLRGTDPWNLSSLPDFLEVQFTDLIAQFRQAKEEIGISEAEIPAVARRVAGHLLANQVLEDLTIKAAYLNSATPWDGPPDYPTVKALNEFMAKVRVHAGPKLAELRTAPFVTKANEGRAEPYKLLKASDMCEFIVKEYAAKDNDTYLTVIEPLEFMGMDLADRKRLSAAGRCLWVEMGFFLLNHKAEVVELIRSSREETP